MKTRILISEEEISRRVAELGREISDFYAGQDFAVIALGNGAVFFAVDLCRKLQGDFTFDYMAVSSYTDNCSSGKVDIRCAPKVDFTGRRVLLIDDVLDTGLTMVTVCQWFIDHGATDVRCAVLAEKEHPRHPAAVGFQADWRGFMLPDLYLIGCGLDIDEHQRQLPYIAVVDNN